MDTPPFQMRVMLSNSVDRITCTEDLPALPAGVASGEATIIPPYFCTPGREIIWDDIRFSAPPNVTCSNCDDPPFYRRAWAHEDDVIADHLLMIIREAESRRRRE